MRFVVSSGVVAQKLGAPEWTIELAERKTEAGDAAQGSAQGSVGSCTYVLVCSWSWVEAAKTRAAWTGPMQCNQST